MIKTGVIHDVNLKKRYFSMLYRRKLIFFYLQHNLIKKFQRYLIKGALISFEYNEKRKVIDKKETFQVEHFIYIARKLRFRRELFYDLSVIRKGIKELLLSLNNIMFLDLEMSMPGYSNEEFKTEIIQAGFLITDAKGTILEEKNYYVRPTISKMLSKRTKKFLNIDDDIFDNALDYQEFYNDFKDYLGKYNPAVIVWGKNDILAIKDSYKYNEVKPLNITSINLLQLQKNYFNLKSDLGLFRAYTLYTNREFEQEHNALEDAIITKEVFFEFKKVVCNNIQIEMPKE